LAVIIRNLPLSRIKSQISSIFLADFILDDMFPQLQLRYTCVRELTGDPVKRHHYLLYLLKPISYRTVNIIFNATLICIQTLLNYKSEGSTKMTVTTINLILATVILILGVWAYFKRRSDVALYKTRSSGTSADDKAIAIPDVALYIGIAFGLYAVSHALTLAGLAARLQTLIIIIRIIGYLLVIVAPTRILLKK